MNILNKLSYLETTKSLIRQAIINKGVPIDVDDTFRSYVEKIEQIQGNTGVILPDKDWDTAFANTENSWSAVQPGSYTVTPWEPDPNWQDIETILEQDTEEYPAKMIVLLNGDSATMDLQHANFYRMSDGVTYTDVLGTQTITHTWDTSLDVYTDTGACTRYVIYYFSDPYVTSRNSYIPSNGIYAISKGVSWIYTNTSITTTAPLNTYALAYNKPLLECLKIKEATFERCTSLYRWCSNSEKLKRVDIDFGNLNAVTFPRGMFSNCSSLNEVNFTNIQNFSTFDRMFESCGGLSYITLDFSDVTPLEEPISTYYMFNGASNLRGVILKFNPTQDKIIDSSEMFTGANNLQWVYIQGTDSYTSFSNLCTSWYARTIYIENSSNVTDFTSCFSGCTNLTNVYIPDLSKAQNVSRMFQNCEDLVTVPELKLPSILTTSPNYMFDGCTRLRDITRLDVSESSNLSGIFRGSGLLQVNLELPEATNISNMFANCTNLSQVVLKGPKVTNMNNCFYSSSLQNCLLQFQTETPISMTESFRNCDQLTEVTMDTSKVTSMVRTFYDCDSLTDIPHLDYSSVTDFTQCFYNCDKLSYVDLSGAISAQNYYATFQQCPVLCYVKLYNEGTVTNLNSTFRECEKLRVAIIGHTGGVTDIAYCFYECQKLISIPELDLTSCTTLDHTFYNCSWIRSITLINIQQITTMSHTFDGCSNLVSIILPACDSLTTMEYAFNNCTELENITIESLPLVQSLTYCFYNCRNLTSIVIPDIPNVTLLSFTFANCSNLQAVEIGTTPKVTTLESCFSNCGKLQAVSALELPQLNTLYNTFYNCSSLIACPIPTISNSVDSLRQTFYGCKSITDWTFLNAWDTSNVTNMNAMFRYCTFETIDLSHMVFNNPQLSYFLANNTNLKSITLDFENRNNTSTHTYMFSGCTNLTEITLLNTLNFGNFSYMYANTSLTEHFIDFTKYTSTTNYRTINYIYSGCSKLERVVWDMGGRAFGNGETYTGHAFTNCPKLQYITIVNCQGITSCQYLFDNIRAEGKVLIDLSDTNHNMSNAQYLFSNSVFETVNYYVAPAYPAYNISNGYLCQTNQYYLARPDQKDAYVTWKLPYKIQINYLKFYNRYSSDGLGVCAKCRFWADEGRTIPLTDELDIEENSYSFAQFDVDNIVTDTIVVECHTADDNCFVGIDSVLVRAKAKGVRQYQSWTRPNLTTNSSVGRVSASSEYSNWLAYKALDGTTGTDSRYSYSWIPEDEEQSWWQWKLPYPIRITSMTHRNSNGPSGNSDNSVEGRFYTDSSKKVPLGDAISTSTTAMASTQISGIPQTGIVTDTIYFEKTGGSTYGGIGELNITADQCLTEWYDWDVDPSTVEEEIHTWEDWQQPILTSNTDYGEVTFSSLFGDDPEGMESISDTDGYYALDNNISTHWVTTANGGRESSLPQWWMWKLPVKLKISKLEFYNRRSGTGSTTYTKTAQFFADEDRTIPLGEQFTCQQTNEIATEISVPDVETDTIYLYITESYRENFTSVGMSELKITAKVDVVSGKVLETLDWYQPIFTSATVDNNTITAISEMPVSRINGTRMFSYNKTYANGTPCRNIILPDTGSIYTMNSMFSDAQTLECIDNWDLSNITGGTRYDRTNIFYHCTSLRGITNIRNIRVSLDISDVTTWNRQTLLNFLNALIPLNRTTAQTLTMGATNLSKLTDEEKAIATSKNWNLA